MQRKTIARQSQEGVNTQRLNLAFFLHFVEFTSIIWNAAVFYAQNQENVS